MRFPASLSAKDVCQRYLQILGDRGEYSRGLGRIKVDTSSPLPRVFLASRTKKPWRSPRSTAVWKPYNHQCGGMSCDQEYFYGVEVSFPDHKSHLAFGGVLGWVKNNYNEFCDPQRLKFYIDLGDQVSAVSTGLSVEYNFLKSKEAFVCVDFTKESCQFFMGKSIEQVVLRGGEGFFEYSGSEPALGFGSSPELHEYFFVICGENSD